MPSSLFILIVGCGRLGSYLASRLSEAGNAVVVIDVHEPAFSNLSPNFSGFRVEGDATELAVLREAKIDKADVFIATTKLDNVNLMTAQIAKKLFAVPRVMARVFNPDREEMYESLGVETVCPTLMAAEVFFIRIGDPTSPSV